MRKAQKCCFVNHGYEVNLAGDSLCSIEVAVQMFKGKSVVAGQSADEK